MKSQEIKLSDKRFNSCKDHQHWRPMVHLIKSTNDKRDGYKQFYISNYVPFLFSFRANFELIGLGLSGQ